MKRLTVLGKNGHAYCDCVLGCYDGCQKILTLLAAYEDTGYMPEEIARLKAENAALKAKLAAAVDDMKVMALAMRESEELSEGCCFACINDAQNLPDNVIQAYGECPGYERDDCFEWRGAQDNAIQWLAEETDESPWPEVERCRICGCTWDNACPGGCYWVEDALCSECVEEARKLEGQTPAEERADDDDS